MPEPDETTTPDPGAKLRDAVSGMRERVDAGATTEGGGVVPGSGDQAPPAAAGAPAVAAPPAPAPQPVPVPTPPTPAADNPARAARMPQPAAAAPAPVPVAAPAGPPARPMIWFAADPNVFGEDTRYLQGVLAKLNFYDPTADNAEDPGTFGSATQIAVEAFQRAVGLQPNGCVDEVTWRSLWAADQA